MNSSSNVLSYPPRCILEAEGGRAEGGLGTPPATLELVFLYFY